MKAAVLKKFGSPLIIEDVPNPKLRGHYDPVTSDSNQPK